jgi:segregation and condensation protein A
VNGIGPRHSLLPETWKVHLPIFEGPLDLLLQLCKLNRVEITELPIATVCDQFHEYLDLMDELNLDIAGDYIYMAALLIHLKSRSLLPQQKTESGEPEEDPREDLVRRLVDYRRLKEAAQSLAEVDSVRRDVWGRMGRSELPADEEQVWDIGDVSLFDLLSALKQTVERYEREHPPPIRLQGESFSVREQLERLLRELAAGRPYDLLQDLRARSCRAEVVAAFLAVLELARLHLIRAHQTDTGEILLYRTTRDIQRHELEAIEG